MKSLLLMLLRAIMRVLFSVKVKGLPQDLDSRRLLIVSNHESFLDGLLIGLFLPFEPVFVVHTGIARNPMFRLILSLSDYLTVDPTSPMAIKQIIKLVDSGRPVVIFPEGRITVTGSLMKVYEGPAFVAAKTRATILPVRLDGPVRSYFSRISGQMPRRLFPKITISIQSPVILEMPPADTARERRHLAGEGMRRLMQKMVFDSHPIQTLYSGLLDAIEVHQPSCNVVEDIKQIEYSYADILKMTLALGRMVEKVTQPGECVGLLMPNMAATVAMLIGMSARGRVPAMLNYKAGTAGMQDACTAAKVKTIIASREFLKQGKLTEDVEALQQVKLLYLEDLRPQFSVLDKLAVLAYLQFPRSFEQVRDSEKPAVVLFTSGSEGKPKGVVLSHRALLSNIAQIRAVIDFSTQDKVLNALPIFHSFGLTAGALLPMLSGMKLFLYPTPLHYRVIPEVVYDRNCSVLFGTSTFLANYAKYAHPYDFFRLRYVVAGAEKLSDSVRDSWVEKFGIRILEGYGATETAPVLAVNTPMAYRRGTVGQFLPGIEHKLVAVPGIEKGGMLHVKGPNVMSGYYRYEQPGVLQPPCSEVGQGWYETGDVVTMEQGFVSIVGRVKRFAKIAGEMVSLEVVEKMAVLASEKGMHAATTQTSPERGEALVLFTTDVELTREQLSQAARELGQPEIAVPRQIRYVDELPLLGTGKIDYVTLKHMAEQE